MVAVDAERAATRGFEGLSERVLTVAGIYGPNASGKSQRARRHGLAVDGHWHVGFEVGRTTFRAMLTGSARGRPRRQSSIWIW